MSLLFYIIGIAIACAFGRLEGILFHSDVHGVVNKLKRNIHFDLTVLRILIYSPMAIAIFFLESWTNSIVFSTAVVLSFSYFHNGMQYVTRNNLNSNIYTERWRAENKNPNSKLSFRYSHRLLQFIMSIIIMITLIRV